MLDFLCVLAVKFPMIIWLTGLSGAGKSTVAAGLLEHLRESGLTPLQIDGDLLRQELCRDLGFDPADRQENIRRAGAIALLAARSGIISVCSLISPMRSEREAIRARAQERGVPFLEVYVSTPLEVCEQRDPKGLYRKARAGVIREFTGIDSPYEPPLAPELVIPAERVSVEDSIMLLKEAVDRYRASTV